MSAIKNTHVYPQDFLKIMKFALSIKQSPKIILLQRIYAKIAKSLFILFALCKLWLFSRRKMKILISNHPGWIHDIKKGFRFTPHKLTFEEFSPANIKKHDLVVPLFIRDVKYLNEVRHLLSDNLIPIPSMECIELCDDKYLFNQLLITSGFSSFIPKMGGILAYPYIMKKRIDEFGKNSFIISDSNLEQLYKDNIANAEYFCQELIPGSSEYASHILFKDGKIVSSIHIEYVFDTDIPIKGKDKAIYTKICDCSYLEIFSSILMKIDFNGLCCFNYKVVDNHPYIFELNPRFGRSLCTYFFSFIGYLE